MFIISISKSIFCAIGLFKLVNKLSNKEQEMNNIKNSTLMPPHVLVDFVVFPPGHGRSVTDF